MKFSDNKILVSMPNETHSLKKSGYIFEGL